jgi:hypothetical protein
MKQKLPKKNLIINNNNNDNNNVNVEFNSDNSISMAKILKKKTKIENICDVDDSRGKTVVSSRKEGNIYYINIELYIIIILLYY